VILVEFSTFSTFHSKSALLTPGGLKYLKISLNSIGSIRPGAPAPPGEHFLRKSELFAKIINFKQKVLNFMKFRYFSEILHFSRPGRKTYIITVVYLVFFHDFCSKSGISRNFMNYATFSKKCVKLRNVQLLGIYATFTDFTPRRPPQPLQNIRVGAFWHSGTFQTAKKIPPRKEFNFLDFPEPKMHFSLPES